MINEAKVLETGHGCRVQGSPGGFLIGLAKGHPCVVVASIKTGVITHKC